MTARTLLWGLFLSCSWTWCIGMFLPLLLLREWGWAGFITFAIPNVIGASAMGYAITRDQSRDMVYRHGSMMAWFSLATIAYQSFFAAWASWRFIAPALAGSASDPLHSHDEWSAWLAGSAFIAVATLLLRPGRDRGWLLLALALWLLSMGLWIGFGVRGWRDVGEGAAPPGDLWLLSPAIALGFFVCPFLDLTFHRALQQSPSRRSFIIFGITFTPMLLFAAATFGGAAPVVTALVAIQWLAQLAFTSAAHAREVARPEVSGHPGGAGILLAIILGACLGAPGAGGEANYLRLLGLYGLVFPACLLLRRSGVRPIFVAIFVLISLPFFSAGFIGWPRAGDPRVAWAPLIPISLLVGKVAVTRENKSGGTAECSTPR